MVNRIFPKRFRYETHTETDIIFSRSVGDHRSVARGTGVRLLRVDRSVRRDTHDQRFPESEQAERATDRTVCGRHQRTRGKQARDSQVQVRRAHFVVARLTVLIP